MIAPVILFLKTTNVSLKLKLNLLTTNIAQKRTKNIIQDPNLNALNIKILYLDVKIYTFKLILPGKMQKLKRLNLK